ncbi:heavy-metal-associated domain-containing protein [Candidatus Woesearchaeota archaeon]|nr:heavy-metal-associated domain-containing protein [Candidatus Woesearchaeota archaeon]
MEKKIIVKGMHCKSCEILIKDELEEAGIKARVDYKKGEVTIENFDSKTDLANIHKIIEKNGYKVMK